jgi:hypothetical protein
MQQFRVEFRLDFTRFLFPNRNVMKMMRSNIILILISLAVTGLQAQLPDVAKKLLNTGTASGLTEQDAASGIREALQKGIATGVEMVSKPDGYFANPQIKIPFPENVREIDRKLRSMGLGSLADEVILTMNRAAEDAAKQALPIFTSAIKKMTVNDAIGIVKGPQDAATQYLARTSTPALKDAFRPVIRESLNRVNATQAWEAAVKAYNQIPFVKKQDTDLTEYVTGKAIDGLFKMIAKEELKIRQDPVARTTDILKKVFGN